MYTLVCSLHVCILAPNVKPVISTVQNMDNLQVHGGAQIITQIKCQVKFRHIILIEWNLLHTNDYLHCKLSLKTTNKKKNREHL